VGRVPLYLGLLRIRAINISNRDETASRTEVKYTCCENIEVVARLMQGGQMQDKIEDSVDGQLTYSEDW